MKSKTRKMGPESKLLRRSPKTIELKLSNPKDAIGIRKFSMSTIPMQIVAEMSLGMLEGSCGYGRSNYRVCGARASVYFDAAMRHLMGWWEGQDIDPKSGLSHVTKALTSLAVLRDCMLNGNLTDDRPPEVSNQAWVDEFNRKAGEILDRFPNKKPAITRSSTLQLKKKRK